MTHCIFDIFVWFLALRAVGIIQQRHRHRHQDFSHLFLRISHHFRSHICLPNYCHILSLVPFSLSLMHHNLLFRSELDSRERMRDGERDSCSSLKNKGTRQGLRPTQHPLMFTTAFVVLVRGTIKMKGRSHISCISTIQSIGRGCT